MEHPSLLSPILHLDNVNMDPKVVTFLNKNNFLYPCAFLL